MSSAVDKSKVPWWVSNLIVPIVNLILALLVSALFIFIAGENPIEGCKINYLWIFWLYRGFCLYSLLYYKFYFYWFGICCCFPLSSF